MSNPLDRRTLLETAIRDLESRLDLSDANLRGQEFRDEIKAMIRKHRPIGSARVRILAIHSKLMEELERRSAHDVSELKYMRDCRDSDSLAFLLDEISQYSLGIKKRYVRRIFEREIRAGRLRRDGHLAEFAAKTARIEEDRAKLLGRGSTSEVEEARGRWIDQMAEWF